MELLKQFGVWISSGIGWLFSGLRKQAQVGDEMRADYGHLLDTQRTILERVSGDLLKAMTRLGELQDDIDDERKLRRANDNRLRKLWETEREDRQKCETERESDRRRIAELETTIRKFTNPSVFPDPDG